jgi:hypothetical protein
MRLASLAFLIVLVVAHLAGDPAEGLALPLSMFRDGAYRPFGYLLFAPVDRVLQGKEESRR